MEKSKLYKVISTLSTKELNNFKLFLSSKLFNHRDPLIPLLVHLKKQQSLKLPDFSLESAFLAMFPNQKPDETVVRHHMSYLFKALERFLAFTELYSNQHTEELALCRAYRKRNIPKLFEATLKKTKNSLTASNRRNISHHITVFELEKESFDVRIQENRYETTNLQEMNNQLDISCFAQKLRQCCLMMAHENIYDVEFDMGIIPYIIQEIEQKELYNIPTIGIYYYTYKAQLESDNIHVFKQLQNQLISYADLFEPIELGQSYLLAINIGIKLLNRGEYQLMKEILELYKSGIESKVLLFNNQLSQFTYKNATTLAIRLKEYDWAKEFIHSYKKLLPIRFLEEAHSYNLAHLYYGLRKYDKALNLLMTIAKSNDVFINLDTKVLLTRIYYEQNQLGSLEAQINSFKTFIRRKKMSYQEQHYRNFVNTVNKLTRLNPYDRSAKKQLRKEVETLQQLPVKYWFLECLE